MKFRYDIQGLRALAVIPVIFFHTGIPIFAGGYVGVDVFFVISGFVIAKSIEGDLRSDKYSIWRFYSKRIRRIFPALFATIICTWIAGWFLLLPEYFENLSKSTAAASVFGANVFFWSESSNYFAALSHTRALLHTWSLSLEEQYYIFSPIATYAIYRYFNARWVLAFLPVIFISFVWSVWSTSAAPTSNFYMLPSRTWELLMGALLAHSMPKQLSSQWKSELLGWIGFGMIIFSITTYDLNTPFPGHYALIPCLGTALLLYVGISNTVVSKILSTKPLAIIGDMSYSLYLVHWPVIVFAYFITLKKPTYMHIFWIVVITFVLSYLSWKYVEGPFRHIDTKKHRKKILGSGVLVISLFFGLGVMGASQDGFPQRFPDYEYVEIPGNKKLWNRGVCFLSNPYDHTLWSAEKCALTEGSEEVLLWGDSFAAHYVPGIVHNKEKFSSRILQYTAAGCPPVLSYVSLARPNCTTFNQNALHIIDERKIKKVILTARWSVVKSREGLESIHSTLKELEKRNVDVFVVGQSPEFAIDVRVLEYSNRELYKNHDLAWWEPSFDTTINSDLEQIIGKDRFINPIGHYCKANMCVYTEKGKFLFEDHAHYSAAGSIRAVQKYFPLKASHAQKETSIFTPLPRIGKWMDIHLKQKQKLSEGNKQILWLGDSITHQWSNTGKESWDKLAQSYSIINLGIGGDKIENLLWRISDLDWNSIEPKIIVVMIGTNNISHENNTPQQIYKGIIETTEKLHHLAPNSKIILFNIFPRGDNSNNPNRKIAKSINTELEAVSWPPHVHYHTFWNELLEPDGSISSILLPDTRHLSAKGFEQWAEEVKPLFDMYISNHAPKE